MGKKVTLKQIAEMADVSLTTVHRVLNGKGGCSKEVEDKILTIAKEKATRTALSRWDRGVLLRVPIKNKCWS